MITDDLSKGAAKYNVKIFNAGHYDILIISAPKLRSFWKEHHPSNIYNVVNLSLPKKYEDYALSLVPLDSELGSVLSFVNVEEEAQLEKLEEFQKKNILPGLMTELLINWSEVERLSYRIKEVKNGLTPKLIQSYRESVIRKQLLKSKEMQKHFEENPVERKMLMDKGGANCTLLLDLKKRSGNLGSLPDYL